MTVDPSQTQSESMAEHHRDLLRYWSAFTPEVCIGIAERNGSPPPIIEPYGRPTADRPRAQIRPLRKAV
jgi:hypothetical protein